MACGNAWWRPSWSRSSSPPYHEEVNRQRRDETAATGPAANLAQVHRAQVERLHEVLADPGLIERVVLDPAENGLQVVIVGEIVRVELGLAARQAALPQEAACSVEVVAGAGFGLCALFVAPGLETLGQSMWRPQGAATTSHQNDATPVREVPLVGWWYDWWKIEITKPTAAAAHPDDRVVPRWAVATVNRLGPRSPI
jgi:hypothetical protein